MLNNYFNPFAMLDHMCSVTTLSANQPNRKPKGTIFIYSENLNIRLNDFWYCFATQYTTSTLIMHSTVAKAVLYFKSNANNLVHLSCDKLRRRTVLSSDVSILCNKIKNQPPNVHFDSSAMTPSIQLFQSTATIAIYLTGATKCGVGKIAIYFLQQPHTERGGNSDRPPSLL